MKKILISSVIVATSFLSTQVYAVSDDLIKAANNGDAESQYKLGNMYYLGEGVSRNYFEAIKWYREAAKQGHAKAQNNLGVMYANGKGVRYNLERARIFYGEACDNGSQEGCNNYNAILNKR